MDGLFLHISTFSDGIFVIFPLVMAVHFPFLSQLPFQFSHIFIFFSILLDIFCFQQINIFNYID